MCALFPLHQIDIRRIHFYLPPSRSDETMLLKLPRLLPMASLSTLIVCASCLADAAAHSGGRRMAYRSQNHLIYTPPSRPPDIFDDATCRREIGGYRRRPSRLHHLSSIPRGGGGNIDDDSDCNEEGSSCSEEQEIEPSNENESADGNIEDEENYRIHNPPLRMPIVLHYLRA